MKALNAIRIAGREVLPLIEGGKGVSITTGDSSGAWAAQNGIGTVSAVNADSWDADGNIIPQVYYGKTRPERHLELIKYAIDGGIEQVKKAFEIANGQGRLNINVLWEMGAAEAVLHGVLEGAKGLVNGVTCGAGMPYKLGEIAAKYGVHFYPIISSGRAFRALWKRAYHKAADWLGGVVYEDPWLAGGHNGITNSEDPLKPEDPYGRVVILRQMMRELGLGDTPIIMAGGVWHLRDWEDWIDNPELGPIMFQFGTRPLLTKESPIPERWKQALTKFKRGDVSLHKFSPTGFYSSAIHNDFLRELEERSDRQISFVGKPDGDMTVPLDIGVRASLFVTQNDQDQAQRWRSSGFTEAIRTPDQTLIFVTPEKKAEIHTDQQECMGCLKSCHFSSWADHDKNTTGRKADPRSFCIQKTLQHIAHGEPVNQNLMFAGHSVYKFASDPFYSNGFVPTVKQLVDRIITGD